MDIPLDPNFLKKVRIYQTLKLNERKEKVIWKAELFLLKWAAGPNHQHTGDYIPKSTASDALYSEIGDKKLSADKGLQACIGDIPKVFRAMVNDGFAEHNPQSENEIKINKNGLLMGKVLREADTPFGKLLYFISSNTWWIIFFTSLIVNLSNLVNKFFPRK